MRRAPLIGLLTVGFAALAAPSATGQVYYLPPPPPPPPPPTACDVKFTAKLALARASTRGGVLDVLAPITSRASGRVKVEYFAARNRNRFTAAVNSTDGRIRFRRNLPSRQARLGTGILTIDYNGDTDTRPQTVRLRGANTKANLSLSRPTYVDGRIRASGRISSRARGIVRLQLEYQTILCNVQILKFRGRISNGRWSINEELTAAQQFEIATRLGTVHSYTLFTGYFPRRMRGEMRAFQVLGDR